MKNKSKSAQAKSDPLDIHIQTRHRTQSTSKNSAEKQINKKQLKKTFFILELSRN